MSQLSVRLNRRVVAVPIAPTLPVTSTLADVRPGSTVRIVEVCDDLQPATARRLVHLGFAPGAEVVVLRRAPLADPVIFRLAGYEVALRRVHARCVGVSADQ